MVNDFRCQPFCFAQLDNGAKMYRGNYCNSGLQPKDIDAVNAHATSTKVGDKVEADALHNIFGKNIPPVSANKSQLGHAMGASSAIEAILAMEGMIKETLLPTINYVPDPAIKIDCVAEGARN